MALHRERGGDAARELTDVDITATEKLLEMDHQDINTALRADDPAIGDDLVVRNAMSALNKLPDTEGMVHRGIAFDRPEDLQDFLNRYEVGGTVREKGFTHSDKAEIGSHAGNVKLHIDARHGKDLTFLRDPYRGIQEVVHPPHTDFFPTAKHFDPETNTWHVYVRDHSGPASPHLSDAGPNGTHADPADGTHADPAHPGESGPVHYVPDVESQPHWRDEHDLARAEAEYRSPAGEGEFRMPGERVPDGGPTHPTSGDIDQPEGSSAISDRLAGRKPVEQPSTTQAHEQSPEPPDQPRSPLSDRLEGRRTGNPISDARDGHIDTPPSTTHQQAAHPQGEHAPQPGSNADRLSGDSWGSADADGSLPPGERELLDGVGRDVDAMLHDQPEISAVVKKLTADDHPLNVTDKLRDPGTRQATLDTLKELADGRVLGDRPLLDFLRENPGQGTLFETIPEPVNKLPDGTTRKDAFVRESQQTDPVRSVGPDPSPEEIVQVRDYARRLRAAEPVVKAEVRQLVEGLDAEVSVRTKAAAGLIDKVQRMTSGTGGREPRPDYKVGDVIDAVGARITVKDTAELAKVIERVREHFGFGDGGRILEVENMYAEPKAHNPAYRVVPMIIKVESGGQVYTFELQLPTRRASVAADMNHNTIYKPYIEVTGAEQAKVARMFEEAAALEQIENRGLNNG
jgi:ppGpp synthetase/RelA/SpoT-type nucleotidyltranferase